LDTYAIGVEPTRIPSKRVQIAPTSDYPQERYLVINPEVKPGPIQTFAVHVYIILGLVLPYVLPAVALVILAFRVEVFQHMKERSALLYTCLAAFITCATVALIPCRLLWDLSLALNFRRRI